MHVVNMSIFCAVVDLFLTLRTEEGQLIIVVVHLDEMEAGKDAGR